MKIAIDNVNVDIDANSLVDLTDYKSPSEKYVHAVDSRVDMIITSDKAIAEFFRDNGIAALIKV